jgi:hypothetical protein
LTEKPGFIVLLGSGESSASGQKVFDWLFRRLPTPVRVAILETPAGFELNSAQVAGRIGEFLEHRLQNYHPQVTIVPARKRGTALSPDEPEIAAQIPGADAVFMGPGSPTYAVRQLRDSLAWQTMVACHRLGVALVLSSAASVAAGTLALPVYEIYKVGEDLHWHQGLDFFAPYGLSLVFVPHWNNNDGGTELDTSRCYMGQVRFDPLQDMLPPEVTIVGIDEHTALVLDLVAATGRVLGKDGVTVLRGGQKRRFAQGQDFPLVELGPFRQPAPQVDLPKDLWAEVQAAHARAQQRVPTQPSLEVLTLTEKREAARARRDWATADALRARIGELGWQVLDTCEGPRLEPQGT